MTFYVFLSCLTRFLEQWLGVLYCGVFFVCDSPIFNILDHAVMLIMV